MVVVRATTTLLIVHRVEPLRSSTSDHQRAGDGRLADVTGDGDPKLLVADQNRKLRLYRGTSPTRN